MKMNITKQRGSNSVKYNARAVIDSERLRNRNFLFLPLLLLVVAALVVCYSPPAPRNGS